MIRVLALLGLLGAFAGALPVMLPAAKSGVRLVMARDDPARMADLAAERLSAEDIRREIEAALATSDADLAASYVALGDARGMALPAELRARVTAAEADAHSTWRQMRSFGAGFLTGTPEDLPGFAGAAVGDFMVWGDIRDATREGWKLARGEEADELILGLSTVGLAVTAGTYALGGAPAPVRAGVSLVKGAKRAGRLSAGLGAGLVRSVRESVDFAALRRAPERVAALDTTALKSVVRTERLRDLGRVLSDAGTIEAKAGTRATMESLKVADGTADLSRVARVAEAKGPQTLALLKSFGRGAFAVTGAVLGLVWWGLLALVWLVGAISIFNALVVSLLRPLWRRRRRGPSTAHGRMSAAALPSGGLSH